MAAALAMKTTSKLKRLANVRESSASYQQKWAHAEQHFPATILTRRLANEKILPLVDAKGMKKTSKLKRLARPSAPEEAKRTGIGRKFNKSNIIVLRKHRRLDSDTDFQLTVRSNYLLIRKIVCINIRLKAFSNLSMSLLKSQ